MLAKAFWVMMANIASDNPISVNEIYKTELTIYPNPATDYIYIISPSIKRGQGAVFEIKIYNTLGQCVIVERIPTSIHRIDISQLPDGMYICRINYGEDAFVKKFIIKR